MMLCTFLVQLHRPRPAASSSTMPPHRRSPSGKLFLDTAASSLAQRQAFPHRLPLRSIPPQRSRQLLPLAARTSSSATAPRPAAFAGCPYQQLRHGATASCFRRLPVPAAPPRRHGQLLSPAARTSSSATAPRPATNLIRRRKVLRFG